MQRKKMNNLLKVIGLILILGSTLFTFKFIYDTYKDKQDTNKIIDEIFEDIDVSTPEVEQEENNYTEESIQKEFVLTNNYLGYIEFSNGNKRLITTGTDKRTLDKGLVGTITTSSNLDDEFGNIMLAGHNTYNVFRTLHYLSIGDQIKIVSHQNTYNFYVIEKHTINDDDFSYFKQVKDRKILTLITCMNNGKQRLVVIAELRG